MRFRNTWLTGAQGQLRAWRLDEPGWMESVSFVALSCFEPKRGWTWTKVASARSVVGMDKGIEGIKIISLRHWLQNMGLWHHSCLSLCAQSKAFLILCWLSIVPHKHGNLKLNVLFWGLLCTVGRARELRLGCSPLPTACLALSSAQVVIERSSENTYTWCSCACSLNVKLIVFVVWYRVTLLSNRCSF